MPTPPAVFAELKAARLRAGLSQPALARATGLHQSAIARLEGGRHELTLATLQRLAGPLGVRFEIAVGAEGYDMRVIAMTPMS